MSEPLHAFAGYGIELEYMIVDRHTLSVLPVADTLLYSMAGARVPETRLQNGKLGLSNELVMHLIELKNIRPESALDLGALSSSFQSEVGHVNEMLKPLNACLMPTAMHPWMSPLAETHLWPHDHAEIYRTYDHIFDCRRHGWSNLQSMHLNLPFFDDQEFSRLHAAIRLALPVLPALAASSPFAEGSSSGFLDYRMENYRRHQSKVPSTIAEVIPETAVSRSGYDAQILQPMYHEIAPLDPGGILKHEWLNVRGAVPRFDRSAIEIRMLDLQECPLADCAIAAVVIHLIRELYDEKHSLLAEQQQMATGALVAIMLSCIRDAEQSCIDNVAYLHLMGFPGNRCTAGELWSHLAATLCRRDAGQREAWQDALDSILEHGPLARRILRATGASCAHSRLKEVYRQICDCLAEGRMFHG